MKNETPQQTTLNDLQTLYKTLAEIELFAVAVDNVYFALIHNSEHGVNASLSANGNAMNDYLRVFEFKHSIYSLQLREIFEKHILSEEENKMVFDVKRYCSEHNLSQEETDRICVQSQHFTTDLSYKVHAIKCMFIYSKLINQFSITPSYGEIESWDPYFAILALKIINSLSDHNFEALPYISPLQISFTIETAEKIIQHYSKIFTENAISTLQAKQNQEKASEHNYIFNNPFIKDGCKIEDFVARLSNLKSKYLNENFATIMLTIHQATGYVSLSDHKFHAAIVEHEVLTMRNLMIYLSDIVLGDWFFKTQVYTLKLEKAHRDLRYDYIKTIENKTKEIECLIGSDVKRKVLSLFATENTTSLEQYIQKEPFKLSTTDFQNRWREETFISPMRIYTGYLNSTDGVSKNSLAYTSTKTGIMEWFEELRMVKSAFFYTNRLISVSKAREEAQNAVIGKFWKDSKEPVTNGQLANKVKDIAINRIYVLLAEYADLEIYQGQYESFLRTCSSIMESMHLAGIRYVEKRFDILVQDGAKKQNAEPASYFSSYMTMSEVMVNLYQQSVNAKLIRESTKQHIAILENEIKTRAEQTIKLQQKADKVFDELMAEELEQDGKRDVAKSKKKKQRTILDNSMPQETNEESSEEEAAATTQTPLPLHIVKYNTAVSLPIYSKEKISALEQARDEAMSAKDNLYRTYTLSALCDAHLYRAKAGLKKYFKANASLLSADDILFLRRTAQSAKNALSYGRATNAQIKMLALKQDIVSGLRWHFVDDNKSPEINTLLTKVSERICKSLETRSTGRTNAQTRLQAQNRTWFANKDLDEVSKASQLWYDTKILSKEFIMIKDGLYDFGKEVLGSSAVQTTASTGIVLQNSTSEYKAFEFGALQKPIESNKKI